MTMDANDRLNFMPERVDPSAPNRRDHGHAGSTGALNIIVHEPDFTTRAFSCYLRDNRDRRLPERALLCRWIEHCYLTVIVARGKMAKTYAEAQRHRFERVTHCTRHLHGLRLEHLGLSLIEANKCNQGLYGGHVLLVSLQVHIQIAALAEDPGYAWNQLLSIQHQWIGCLVFGPLFRFGGVVDRVLQIRTLATQHNRADRHPLLFFVEIRNDERSFERSNPSRLIIPREKLDGVFAG